MKTVEWSLMFSYHSVSRASKALLGNGLKPSVYPWGQQVRRASTHHTLFLPKLTIILSCLSGTSASLVHKSNPSKFMRNHLSSAPVLPRDAVITHHWAGRVRPGSCFLSMKTQNTAVRVRPADILQTVTLKRRTCVKTHQLELHLRLNLDLWINGGILS